MYKTNAGGIPTHLSQLVPAENIGPSKTRTGPKDTHKPPNQKFNQHTQPSSHKIAVPPGPHSQYQHSGCAYKQNQMRVMNPQGSAAQPTSGTPTNIACSPSPDGTESPGPASLVTHNPP